MSKVLKSFPSLLLVVVLAIGGVSGPLDAVAKDTPTAIKKRASKGTQAMVFDPAMIAGEYLSQDFYAYDIKDVIKALEKVASSPLEKYESTDEYRARLEGVYSKTKINGVVPGEPIAVIVPVNSVNLPYEGVKFTYDADKQKLDFNILAKKKIVLNTMPSARSEPIQGYADNVIDIERIVDSKSEYVASNAMGARATVNSYKMSQFSILSGTIDWLAHERKTAYVFKMPSAATVDYSREQARQSLDNLQAVLLLKVKFPYMITGFDIKSPTFNDTEKRVIAERYLTADLQGVVFFDSKTKKVIHRIPENFGR